MWEGSHGGGDGGDGLGADGGETAALVLHDSVDAGTGGNVHIVLFVAPAAEDVGNVGVASGLRVSCTQPVDALHGPVGGGVHDPDHSLECDIQSVLSWFLTLLRTS